VEVYVQGSRRGAAAKKVPPDPSEKAAMALEGRRMRCRAEVIADLLRGLPFALLHTASALRDIDSLICRHHVHSQSAKIVSQPPK
jgi:hypothetical protein